MCRLQSVFLLVALLLTAGSFLGPAGAVRGKASALVLSAGFPEGAGAAFEAASATLVAIQPYVVTLRAVKPAAKLVTPGSLQTACMHAANDQLHTHASSWHDTPACRPPPPMRPHLHCVDYYMTLSNPKSQQPYPRSKRSSSPSSCSPRPRRCSSPSGQ